LAYIPETVMNCDVDYVNKLEKYKCLGNTIDGNIFNKHNDQEKKTLEVLSISHKMADYFAFPLLL
jgi:translation elongation factor EF-Ts